MKTLHVSVNSRIASYRKRDGGIICGNSDYVVKFAFDEEWDSHQKKTVRFIYNGIVSDVHFEGDTVAVPILRNVRTLEVGVYAGNLQTTTPARIPCVKSILCGAGAPPASIPGTPTLPTVTAADNGKILQVVDGVWTAVEIPNAEEVSV